MQSLASLSRGPGGLAGASLHGPLPRAASLSAVSSLLGPWAGTSPSLGECHSGMRPQSSCKALGMTHTGQSPSSSRASRGSAAWATARLERSSRWVREWLPRPAYEPLGFPPLGGTVSWATCPFLTASLSTVHDWLLSHASSPQAVLCTLVPCLKPGMPFSAPSCHLSAWSQLCWGPWRALPGSGSRPKCSVQPAPQHWQACHPVCRVFFLKYILLLIIFSLK